MIVSDNLNTFVNHVSNPVYIEAIRNYLATAYDPEKLVPGEKIDIANNVSMIFINSSGTLETNNILEAHRKFFDLHYTLNGTDVIVYKSVDACQHIEKDYDPNGDYMLFNESPTNKLDLAKGFFCLISPDYAHMALYGTSKPVRKIVFKVPVK